MALLNRIYYSEAKMDSVTDKLPSLTLRDYEDDGKTGRHALKELTTKIENFAPMANFELRTDFAKRIFLENVVKGRDWALMVSANHEVVKLTYLQYRTYLEKFQSKWSSFAAASVSSSNKAGGSKFRSSRWKGVNHAGPSKFGRYPSSSRSTTRRVMKCFNCGEENCRVKTCKKPMELQLIAHNFAKFRETKNSAQFTEAFYALGEIFVSARQRGHLKVDPDNTSRSDSEGSQESGTKESPPSRENILVSSMRLLLCTSSTMLHNMRHRFFGLIIL